METNNIQFVFPKEVESVNVRSKKKSLSKLKNVNPSTIS